MGLTISFGIAAVLEAIWLDGGHRRIGFACQVSITQRNSVATIE